nr:uncharacterized protein LOC113739942 [Coffea arabica]
MAGHAPAPRKQYDPYSNTYNPGWRDHPNLSYGGNRQSNFVPNRQQGHQQQYHPRPPPPPPPSNSSPSMEEMMKQLLANQQKTDSDLQSMRNQLGQVQSLQNQMNQMAITINRLESQVQGKLPSQPEANPKNVSAMTLRSGKEVQGPEPVIPKDKDEERIEKELEEEGRDNKNAKVRKIFEGPVCQPQAVEGDERVIVGENVSAILQRKLPPKCGDPGPLKETGIIIQLADRTNAYPDGLIEDVLAPVLELKPLPKHLKYVYLGEGETLPVIISAGLSKVQEEKLLRVLREHKQAIGWTIADIKGISPRCVCTEFDSRRMLNPYDSPWVSPVQVVPKKAGVTVESNQEGYFQIAIAPEDQEKTTFTCPFGTFAYRRMPFGLCNAPATFQRCMVSIFSEYVEKIIEVFMDDFSVYGIEVDKAKIDVISTLPYPASVREVRSFLGHAGFYRRFIKDFSKIGAPLFQLLQKDVSFEFDETCKGAFNKLKELLTTSPIIQPPDWNLPFEIMCDASDYAVVRFAVSVDQERGKTAIDTVDIVVTRVQPGDPR